VVTLVADVSNGFQLAAALASRSDHPVSSAINRFWSAQASGTLLADVNDFSSVPGRGIKGRILDHWYYLGNHQFVQESGICTPSMDAILEKLEAKGKTVVILFDGKTPIVAIGVSDVVRYSSRQAMAELHSLGVRTLMLSGDNAHTASVIARAVGIDDAHGDLLPEHKLLAIEDELARFSTVGMVGDGINDAPALAKASIAFAMGAAGSDTAIETADVALMDDDLLKIPQFIRLSRRTVAVLSQNITIALGIKALFFLLALFGKASLWMAVFADMGTSLLVVCNGLRMLRALPKVIKKDLERILK